MPLRDRDLSPTVSPGTPTTSLRERALEVLLAPELAHVVALVCWQDGDSVVVADSRGRSALAADGTTTLLEGADPVADQDPYSDADRCYPLAGVRLHGLFAGATELGRAPDLAVVHTGDHDFRDHGGHVGEHGSLNGLQSRAPLLLSGAGVSARGVLDRFCRTVDVGATLAHLSGGDLTDLEGTPLPEAVPGAKHVVGLLWDGAPCAEVLALAASGDLPNVARLLARGCAFRGGAVAEFPSVTLVNHTCALTGVGPGRHGIVNNAYYDRMAGTQVVPNSHATWHEAMQHLRPGIRTVWERLPEGAASACVNEPCDTGATYSTFGLIRAAHGGGTGSLVTSLPDAAGDPHATAAHVEQTDYAWGTQIDAVGLEQVLGLWREGEPPLLTWWNTTLTDGAHHVAGPGTPMARDALRDADRRLGAFLDLLDARGLTDDVTVLLTADHGMQGSVPGVVGDWDAALTAAGIPFRDEANGFLYLGDDVVGGA
ncbi:MAG: type phosphodiesterase/nucleotide pyrophosphatase [Frankiales bacterium]|nr:type phosphodiesterase/nucleotide pyrophosphatase [Frankiales bacterium]